MDEIKYVGRRIENITVSKFDGEQWTVSLSLTHSRKASESDEWETKTLEASATSKNEEEAYSAVATDVLNILEELGGDIFSQEGSTYNLEIQDGTLGANSKLVQ